MPQAVALTGHKVDNEVEGIPVPESKHLSLLVCIVCNVQLCPQRELSCLHTRASLLRSVGRDADSCFLYA